MPHLRKVSGKCGNSVHLPKVEWHGGIGNAATGGSRDGTASAHLWKVSRKCGEMAHLRKVGMARGKGNTATGGSRDGTASAHLWKVSRKCGNSAHLRKVGMVEGVRGWHGGPGFPGDPRLFRITGKIPNNY